MLGECHRAAFKHSENCVSPQQLLHQHGHAQAGCPTVFSADSSHNSLILTLNIKHFGLIVKATSRLADKPPQWCPAQAAQQEAAG